MQLSSYSKVKYANHLCITIIFDQKLFVLFKKTLTVVATNMLKQSPWFKAKSIVLFNESEAGCLI